MTRIFFLLLSFAFSFSASSRLSGNRAQHAARSMQHAAPSCNVWCLSDAWHLDQGSKGLQAPEPFQAQNGLPFGSNKYCIVPAHGGTRFRGAWLESTYWCIGALHRRCNVFVRHTTRCSSCAGVCRDEPGIAEPSVAAQAPELPKG